MMGKKLGMSAGVCPEPCQKFMRSRKHTPQSQGSVLSWLTQAMWTRGRLHDVGYPVSPMCVKCGCAEDTPHHRLRVCQDVEVKAERKKAASKAFVRMATKEVDDTVLNTGWAEHPRHSLSAPRYVDPVFEVWDGEA